MNKRTMVPVGSEQFEEFYSALYERTMVQYDYRHTNGRLFTCVAKTVEEARKQKTDWLTKHGFAEMKA